MKREFDIIIVGSGPAGVSAAFPLVHAGLNVLMVDAGKQTNTHQAAPNKDYLITRAQDNDQWKWMIGEDFHAFNSLDAVSPKLRVPLYAPVFDEFKTKNSVTSDEFVTVGSLATGGLSNAWGCGVARLSQQDMLAFPFSLAELDRSYTAVSRRMGISGQVDDDLSDYFGLDADAQPPISLDRLHASLWAGYQKNRKKWDAWGFKLGCSRVAALSQPMLHRRACHHSSNCLWGCGQDALYSAKQDLLELKKYTNFKFISGCIVQDFVYDQVGWRLVIEPDSDAQLEASACYASKLILAAGTLSTTRLILKKLNYKDPCRLWSCPTAAFLVWLPRLLGIPRTPGFGLGQLSYLLDLQHNIHAFGSTFSTTGLLVSEFVRHAPLKRRHAVDLFSRLLSSCVVGNLFLPGHLTHANVQLQKDNALHVMGEYDERVTPLMRESARILCKAYRKMGAILIPKSFRIGSPGADIHYAGTLPMRAEPELGETSKWGEVFGLKNVYVVDGACLPVLSEKSHTLTIMANADRIAQHLVTAFEIKPNLH